MIDDPIQNRLDFGDAHSVAEQGLKVVTAKFIGVEPFSWDCDNLSRAFSGRV